MGAGPRIWIPDLGEISSCPVLVFGEARNVDPGERFDTESQIL